MFGRDEYQELLDLRVEKQELLQVNAYLRRELAGLYRRLNKREQVAS